MPKRPADDQAEAPAHDAAHCGLNQEIAAIRKQIRGDRQSGKLWQQLGLLEMARGRRRFAQRALENASWLIPLSRSAQLALAECYAGSGFVQTARAMYEHLAGAVDLPISQLRALASGLERCGCSELALAVYRELAQQLPTTGEPLYGIARCLRRVRKPADAVLPYLKQAFELDPTNTACRISLAWTLHACGRSVAGAELLDTIPVAELECVASLTYMRRVFEAAADEHCASICKYRLEALAAQRWRERP